MNLKVGSTYPALFVVPLHFLALQVQLVVLVSAFLMVSTVWSVSCLLFFYSWCPRVQPFVKVAARAPRAIWSQRHWKGCKGERGGKVKIKRDRREDGWKGRVGSKSGEPRQFWKKIDAYDSNTSSVMEKLANLGNVSSGIDLGDRLPDQLLLDGNDALVVLQPVHFRIQRLWTQIYTNRLHFAFSVLFSVFFVGILLLQFNFANLWRSERFVLAETKQFQHSHTQPWSAVERSLAP